MQFAGTRLTSAHDNSTAGTRTRDFRNVSSEAFLTGEAIFGEPIIRRRGMFLESPNAARRLCCINRRDKLMHSGTEVQSCLAAGGWLPSNSILGTRGDADSRSFFASEPRLLVPVRRPMLH